MYSRIDIMKLKCSFNDCCKCHNDGHEWEGEQKSSHYILCPMCRRFTRIKARVLD